MQIIPQFTPIYSKFARRSSCPWLTPTPSSAGNAPQVMGRKNYLFSQNDRGAEDNAVFYTLLVSCDNLNVPPLEWLTHTLERIKPDMDEDQLMALLLTTTKPSSNQARL